MTTCRPIKYTADDLTEASNYLLQIRHDAENEESEEIAKAMNIALEAIDIAWGEMIGNK